jgi:hypothetical protein
MNTVYYDFLGVFCIDVKVARTRVYKGDGKGKKKKENPVKTIVVHGYRLLRGSM